MPPSASPSDGGCAEGSFGLTALAGWGRGAFPQPWVGGCSPCAPLRGSCPTQNCPRCPTAGLLGLQGASPRGSPVTAALRGLVWIRPVSQGTPAAATPAMPQVQITGDSVRTGTLWGARTTGLGMAAGWGAGTHHLWGHGSGELPSLAATPSPKHPKPPPQHPKAPEHPYPAGEQSLGKGWARCGGARHPPVHFLHRGHSCPHLRPPPQVSPQKTRKKQCEVFFFFSSLAIIKKDSPFRALSIPGGREEREGRKGKTVKEKRGRAWEGEEKAVEGGKGMGKN